MIDSATESFTFFISPNGARPSEAYRFHSRDANKAARELCFTVSEAIKKYLEAEHE